MPDWKREVESRLGPGVDAAAQSDLAEELAQHLEDRYRELLSGGADEAAARDAVLAELAELERLPAALPPSRRAPKHAPVPTGAAPGTFFADFARDLRYALRGMRKAPAFTFFAVLTLGAGIGANTTVFTIINTLLVHPLPVRDASRLAALYDTGPNGRRQAARLPLSYPNFADYAAQQTNLRDIAAFTPPMALTLRGPSGPERMFGEFATRRYFDTLGLRPATGRFFRDAEDTKPGSAPVAVVSYNAWKGRFGASADILGRTLELNGVSFTVVGVAPQSFLGVSAIFGPDVWLPATMCERVFPAEFANALSDRGKPLFHGVGRLRAGATRTQAQAALDVISAGLGRAWPDTDKGHRILVRPVMDELYSGAGGANGLAFGGGVLLTIVALILGIACSNVANLLLARGAARTREVAVRLATGADRGRLVRQMLTESLLLSLASCAAGIFIGYEGCRFVWSFVPAEVRGNMVTPRLDAAVLAAALVVSVITAFVFGLAPALRAAGTDLVSALKEDTRAAGGRRRGTTFPNVLLAGQVAFSLVCLITAALFFRSIQRAYTLDPGFQTGHLALFLTNAAQSGYDETRLKEFYRTTRERVAGLPGVASVSWASGLPFWNSPSRSIAIEGAEEHEKSQTVAAVVLTVDTGYFATMGIPLARGRLFTDGDRDGSAPVAIINERLAREHWPNGDALGHRFQFAGDGTRRQVAGIVKNANYTTLGEAPQPCVYLPLRQNFSQSVTLYVRTTAAPAGLLAPVQEEIRRSGPEIEASDVRTGGKLIEQVLWGPKVGVALLGVFGSLALALASVGLYGVMAYSVNRRRREIGVRMALGASRGAVLRLVLREGMAVVGCGLALGLALFLPLGSALSRMLFGTSPTDPASLAAASAVLIAAAMAACSVPALAATRVDPMAALREG